MALTDGMRAFSPDSNPAKRRMEVAAGGRARRQEAIDATRNREMLRNLKTDKKALGLGRVEIPEEVVHEVESSENPIADATSELQTQPSLAKVILLRPEKEHARLRLLQKARGTSAFKDIERLAGARNYPVSSEEMPRYFAKRVKELIEQKRIGATLRRENAYEALKQEIEVLESLLKSETLDTVSRKKYENSLQRKKGALEAEKNVESGKRKIDPVLQKIMDSLGLSLVEFLSFTPLEAAGIIREFATQEFEASQQDVDAAGMKLQRQKVEGNTDKRVIDNANKRMVADMIKITLRNWLELQRPSDDLSNTDREIDDALSLLTEF